jgi:hypothetical protein
LSPEEVIRRIKESVDRWEPTERDIRWLRALVSRLKIGGKWVAPGSGLVFEKVGENHLRLQSIMTKDIINTFLVLEKTRKVGERAGIKVDTEKAADYIIALGL